MGATHERAVAALVVAVLLATVARLRAARRRFDRAFLAACAALQLAALAGLATRDARLIATGHVGFTLAVWVGAAGLEGADLALVAGLAAFTWASRRALGYCLFARARGSAATQAHEYDVLYAVPLAIALGRYAAAIHGGGEVPRSDAKAPGEQR